LWNRGSIDHVQITVAESIGVGTRAGYYDKSGALRDMVQNHLLQLLCLVAMEPPTMMHQDTVRDEKLKVLRALKPITPDQVAGCTVRGQYRAGAIDGQGVPGYIEDLGGQPSRTETFVAIRAEVETWRWGGVPFYLRTGKRLAERTSEIVIQFRPVPHNIFAADAGAILPNRLVIRLQPNEGIELQLMSKDPGPGGMRIKPTHLNLSFAEAFKIRYADAYERLLMDVVRGNSTLFMRRDEVEAAWNWIEPILDGWARDDTPPKPYPAGSWGPAASIAMIERDGRTWDDDGE
jgi:glucose-6-phosphate 1-dehydrogenase